MTNGPGEGPFLFLGVRIQESGVRSQESEWGKRCGYWTLVSITVFG